MSAAPEKTADLITLSTGGTLLWEKRLATAWLLSFAIGVLLIIYVPATRPNRLALPIVVMLLYCGYGLTVKNRHTEKFADSLYFMGFLWTLIALIAALFGGQLKAAGVFRAFGYGLVTTAVGMLLRVLVLQFQQTLSDRVVQAQEDIGRAVAEFLGEMDRASELIVRFRTRAEARLAEELQSLMTALSSVRAAIESTHTSAAQTSTAAIAAAAEMLASRLREFRLPQEEVERETAQLAQTLRSCTGVLGTVAAAFSESMQAVTSKITAAASDVAERIGQIQVPHDALAREIAAACEAVRRSAQVLSRELEAAGGVVSQGATALGASISGAAARAEVDGAVRSLADGARQAAEGYRTLSAAAEASLPGFTAVASALRGVGEGLARINELLRELETGVQGFSAEALSRAMRELVDAERAVAAAQNAGRELHQTVNEVLDFIREQLRSNRAF